MLRIGVSACFFHADPERAIFKGKTLAYLEESQGEWLMRHGALPWLLPRPHADVTAETLVAQVDGVLLQGGSDIAPESYGETPLRPEWQGDRLRDLYEIELVRAAMRQGKPVLGICRGAQLINVALGGTMLQDIQTQHPHHRVHRDWQVYDQLRHDVDLVPGSWLASCYPGVSRAAVNSVHHQGLAKVAEGLRVEARSLPDGVVEAVAHTDPAQFVVGVQWHPEFQVPGDGLLDPGPLMSAFLSACGG